MAREHGWPAKDGAGTGGAWADSVLRAVSKDDGEEPNPPMGQLKENGSTMIRLTCQSQQRRPFRCGRTAISGVKAGCAQRAWFFL